MRGGARPACEELEAVWEPVETPLLPRFFEERDGSFGEEGRRPVPTGQGRPR